MRARELKELNLVIVGQKPEYVRGFLEAAILLDDMYSSCSTHKYLLGDCLLAKVNLLNKKCRVRVNKRRVI